MGIWDFEIWGLGFGGLYLKLDPELLLAQVMKRFDDQHELLSKAGWQLRFSGFGLSLSSIPLRNTLWHYISLSLYIYTYRFCKDFNWVAKGLLPGFVSLKGSCS